MQQALAQALAQALVLKGEPMVQSACNALTRIVAAPSKFGASATRSLQSALSGAVKGVATLAAICLVKVTIVKPSTRPEGSNCSCANTCNTAAHWVV